MRALTLLVLLTACGHSTPRPKPLEASGSFVGDSATDSDVVVPQDTDQPPQDTDAVADTDVAVTVDTDVGMDTDATVDTGPVLTPGTFPAGAYELTPRPLDFFAVNLFADGTWMLWYNERFSGTITATTEWGCWAQGTYTAATDGQGRWHLFVEGSTTTPVEVVVGPGDVWTQDGVPQAITACAPRQEGCSPGINALWVWPAPSDPYHTCAGSFLGVLP